MRKILAIAAILTLACNDAPIITGPGPVTTTTTSVPLVRNDSPPDLWSIVGTSSFALAQYDEHHIRATIEYLRGRGRNCVRVCGETKYWGFGYLPKGPDLQGALEDVRRLLRVSAEYSGFYVLLVPVCTIRDHEPASVQGFVQQIRDLVAEEDYKHVWFEAINEHWHPASHFRNEERVKPLIRMLQTTGRVVGTDDHIVAGNVTYNPALRGVVDFISVHPWRNPEPTVREIKRIVSKNGGLVIFSETTAYASQQEVDDYGLRGKNTVALKGYGTQAERRQVIREYKERCDSVPGCIWFDHSIAGLNNYSTEWWLP